MKKILFTLLFIVACITGFTQLTNNGGAITVESGATLVIEGDYTSSASGDIDIDGTVQLKGHFVNNSGTVNTSSAGTLVFNGTTAQEIKGTQAGGTTFNCNVEIDNLAGVSLTSANQMLAKALTLTNGKLTLNGYDLTLAAVSTITGASSASYVETNSTGKLKRPVAAADVSFPVGTSAFYTPASLINNWTSDVYGVRVFDDVTNNGIETGTTITQIASAVDLTWVVAEDVTGESDLDLTVQWNSGNQGGSFNPLNCGMGHYTTAWNPQQGAGASGSGPYTRTRTDISSVGSFAVGTGLPLSNLYGLNLTAWLSGPYNTSTNLMSISLPTLATFPLTQPYNIAPWNYTGTESVTLVPTNVTDWVLIELRDATSPATATSATRIARMAGFVKNNGTLVNLDGTSNIPFNVPVTNNLYVVIWHRNHIPIISSAGVIDGGDFIYDYDFSTAASKAYTSGPDPMILTEAGGPYALFTGNSYGDKSVQRSGGGSSNDLQNVLTDLGGNLSVTGIYSRSDFNFDKNVQRSGGGTANDFQRVLTVLNGALNRPGYVPN